MGVSLVILHLFIVVFFVGCHCITQTTNTSNVAVEGGSITLPTVSTHMGREHMIKVNHTLPDEKHMLKVNHTQNATTVHDFEIARKNDNKTSVPKKDAILRDPAASTTSTTTSTTSSTSTSTTTTTTTTTQIPQKPTLTIGEDEPPLSEKKTHTQSNDTGKRGFTIEDVTQKTKKTDYVVPIVVVILSVPLVAIIISVLYKRGADWWQHRHYRRMDFLIEGMYNN